MLALPVSGRTTLPVFCRDMFKRAVTLDKVQYGKHGRLRQLNWIGWKEWKSIFRHDLLQRRVFQGVSSAPVPRLPFQESTNGTQISLMTEEVGLFLSF